MWRAALGKGASSVSVVAGRLYSVGNIDGNDVLYCLDAETGRERWRFVYECSLWKRQFEGGPAATPTVSGGRVFALSHEGQVFSLDATTGTLVWSVHATRDLGGVRPTWGFAGSPLVADGKLILDIGGDGGSTTALDAATGQPLWRSGNDGAGYSSPVLFDAAGVSALLVFKSEALVALALADGRELWRHVWETSYGVNASMPIASGNRVFLSSGYDHGAAVLEVVGSGPRVVWESEVLRSQFTSPVLHEGYVYGLDDGGELRCVAFDTGKQSWATEGFGKGSLILAGQTFLVLSEDGEAVLVKADSAKYEELARAKVLEKRTWVAPALAGGYAYLKDNEGNLVCLDMRTNPGAAGANPAP